MHLTPRGRAGLAAVAAVLLGSILPAAPGASAAPSVPAVWPAPGDRAAGTVRPAAGWRVDALGAGRYDVSWTSPRRLPTGGDRPTIEGAGLSFGPSTDGPDHRTVHAVVTSAAAPLPGRLDVVLSGDRLDEPGDDALRARAATSPGVADAGTEAPATHLLDAPDPGESGPFATTTSDYTLPALRVAGLHRPVEMVGHVVEPAPDAAAGPRPLVLFLHGRHDVCYRPGHPHAFTDHWPCQAPFQEIPSQLGYDYLQQLLASQGYATVSVRVNGINAQDDGLADGGAGARAQLVRAHLDHWAGIAAAHQVDLSQVVLVGHSRGGEGVDRGAIQIPLSAPYRIVGQVLIAPVDFASDSAPYIPTVTLLPYCDGDVYDIQGQRFTDTGRDVDPADTSFKSSVLIMGADHNFFNTEWTPGIASAPAYDDWSGAPHDACGAKAPGRLSATEQRSVARAYVAGAVALFTGDQSYLPLFDGSHVTVPSIGDADVRSAAIGGGRSLRRPGIEATPTVPAGGARTQLCTGVARYDRDEFGACGRGRADLITPHWAGDGEGIPTRQFFEMSWNHAGAVGGLRFDAPLDLSTQRLELRTIVDPVPGDVRVRVRIGDGAGHHAVLAPEDGEALPALLAAPSLTKLWAQALLVDATSATGVDLTDITSVELVGESPHGRVWVADLAAAPAQLAPVPATRLPQVQFGDARVVEGDSGGRHVVRVPFHVTGRLTRPARFSVVTTGQELGSVHRFSVDLAPGQTSGSIPVSYTANRLDDYEAVSTVSAWPVYGVATDDYLGTLTVVDDDPAPRILVRTGPHVVREGDTVTLHVSLTHPADYDVSVFGQVIQGRADGGSEPLRGTDVPLSWLSKRSGTQHLDRPLYRLFPYLSADVPARGHSADLTVPIAEDGRPEGSETLTLRLHAGHERITKRFVVLPST